LQQTKEKIVIYQELGRFGAVEKVRHMCVRKGATRVCDTKVRHV